MPKLAQREITQSRVIGEGLVETRLEDVYTGDKGPVFISGNQALVRLPLMQRQRDIAANLDTRGFISGYRGSPLAGYDLTLTRASRFLEQHQITFMPAINEEMAATAIVGTQQVVAQPDVTCDGVFSLWYGKGPGVDRAADALKHANSIGTTPHGGVLIVAGDDHNAVSSAMAHQSEQLFESMLMPVLHPSSIAEIIDYGLLGWAMSRFAGCYVGLKLESETIESAASVCLDKDQPRIILPDFEFPPDGVHYRWPDRQLDAEFRLQNFKIPAALAFAHANRIDKVVMGPDDARFGIITTGKIYPAVRRALEDMGIDDARAAEMGLAVYKVGMPWPLETRGARAFALGLTDILVIEEKRSLIESQLKDALYLAPADRRPSVFGKNDANGKALLPGTGIMSPELIAQAIVRVWPDVAPRHHLDEYLARIKQQENSLTVAAAPRTPFFCSGCPHNRSTVPPEGSRVLAGTGCHLMAVFMDRDTSGFLHMGAEGGNWAGQAPFCESGHIFQNLGDGTYSHSGSLAIRQSVAAGFNITYKILFNDAVAMTGGQSVDSSFTVPQITRQLRAEGVDRIAVVADEPDKYAATAEFAPGATIHHRDNLAEVEKELSSISGVSVLIYDQVCAAEKRRRKRRALIKNAEAQVEETRVFINEAVCEGCGDCVVHSNCLSVVPKETPLGTKRQIDQSSCNTDKSCLQGFCPSFVTITGGEPVAVAESVTAKLQTAVGDLPSPGLAEIDGTWDLVVTGVGGQGVVTISRITGMAAHLDHMGCSVLDFPGLAPKGGGVMSYVRISRTPGEFLVPRVPLGRADLLMAGDMVTALSPEVIGRLRRNRTRAVVNSHLSPTGANVLDPLGSVDAHPLKEGIQQMLGEADPAFINATEICERLSGDAITANIFLLGYACQDGALPIGVEALTEAIRLNGAGVEMNLACFAYGRLAAHNPAVLAEISGLSLSTEQRTEQTLDELVSVRERYLGNYQNAAYGRRYRKLVDAARTAEEGIESAGQEFSKAVARGLFQLMAYKDEYEVARLHSAVEFMDSVRRKFSGDFKITYHLAPPMLARRNPETGIISKITFGSWIQTVFGVLARLKFLRGTPLDVFGYTRERRAERARIVEFEESINAIIASISSENLATAIEVASLASTIRGYGDVKERNAQAAHEALSRIAI